MEKKLVKNLECMGTGENFLNRTPIANTVRWRIDKWYLIKLQRFCKAKDTVNRTKRQPTNWEKIFTNHTSDRGLISNIYKELKKLDTREPNNTIKKWGTELNKEFLHEEYPKAEKHLKKCSTCLGIREIQIRTTLRFHLTQSERLRSNLRREQVLVRMWRKRNTPPLLVGLHAGTTTLEISLVVPQKTGHNSSFSWTGIDTDIYLSIYIYISIYIYVYI